jgi:hypothetical protein
VSRDPEFAFDIPNIEFTASRLPGDSESRVARHP